jgi:hypothetical protein
MGKRRGYPSYSSAKEEFIEWASHKLIFLLFNALVNYHTESRSFLEVMAPKLL